MSPLDHPIMVTFFRDYAASAKWEEPYTPRALAQRIHIITAGQKSRLPWLKLARFGNLRTNKNSLRHDGNVLAITGIEADYDGGQIAVDNAVDLLEKQGVAAILYTSPSHTEDAPRWRVLCPLSTEMEPGHRRHMLGRLNGLFRGIFARESWTLSQAYYFGSLNHNPSHRVELIDGATIDQHDDLDATWIGPSAQSSSAPDQDTPSDAREIAELIRLAVTGAEIHTSLCPLAARLVGRNVGTATVRDILRGVMLSWPEAARNDRWRSRYAEIDQIVDSAVRKYQATATIRRDNNRQLAALAIRLFKQRRPSTEVCEAVRNLADKLGIPEGYRVDGVLEWAAKTEIARRREHA